MGKLSTVNIKEYDSLIIYCEYTDDAGVPLNLDGITIFSDIKSELGILQDNLVTTITNSSGGKFFLTPTCDSFRAGLYKVDILFINTVTQMRVSSETFKINVGAAITTPR